MTSRTIIAVFAFGLLMACGTTSSNSSSSQTEQKSGMCPGTPTILTGTGAAGSSCSSYSSCAPKCCSCVVSGNNYDAASCSDGECSGSPCADTTALCGP